MPGQLFITPGDISQLTADAIAFSTSTSFAASGNLHPAFCAHVPGFAAAIEQLRRDHGHRCHVGDAFWLPLDPARKPHGVAVVAATGRAPDTDDKAGAAVQGAIDCAVRGLRDGLKRTDHLLVALPAFRVGMGGDHRDRQRSARAQVAAALAALHRHPDIDVAFITYTPALYHIFLEARRQILGAPAVPLPTELIRALCAGECVAFIGAGMSRGAALPDWGQLIARLAGELGVDTKDVDYLDLAQWHRERFGHAALAEIIRQTFGTSTVPALPTLAHYLLLSLPVRLVLTTNYDDLIERALAALKRFPVKVARQEDVVRTGRTGEVCVVKIHGDADRAEEIVLSRDDYDEFFERRPAMALLLEGLLLNQTFFFVGYGLRDPNFRQLFSRIGRMLREARSPAFATSFEGGGGRGAYLAGQWQRKQLQLINISGDTDIERQRQLLIFLDRLGEQVSLNEPRLVLAPDVEVAAPLKWFRRTLVEQVGPELEKLAATTPGTPESAPVVAFLAQMLEFLTAQGWRPKRQVGSLSVLWERLALATTQPAERRRLLIAALGAAECFDDVQRIREQLKDGPKSI